MISGSFRLKPIPNTKRLAELESQINRDDDSVGRANESTARALREIRDSRLYRATQKTFKAYLDERWGYSRSHTYRLIDFANELDLSPTGDKPKTERALLLDA